MKTITRYAVNGIEYNSIQEAIEAENKIKEQELAMFDAKREAVVLDNQGKRILLGILVSGSYPLLLEVREKYGSYIYCVNDQESLKEMVLKILSSRVADGYWYSGEDELIAKKIVEEEYGYSALKFLLNRQDDQYEFVDLRAFDKL